jgi:hypothetical protein
VSELADLLSDMRSDGAVPGEFLDRLAAVVERDVGECRCPMGEDHRPGCFLYSEDAMRQAYGSRWRETR